jgi:hypothetical protein
MRVEAPCAVASDAVEQRVRHAWLGDDRGGIGIAGNGSLLLSKYLPA